ncbi:MAG: DNA-binding protein [Agitococcus sp.]|nr:DNA-binding protein [Agitococcus sp.]MDO9177004.1 DNA-binding protein [Agitococcus sp.]
MARLTDTREKVREAAQLIRDNGGIPTPTVIRNMLGGKGSPNTIVQELKKFMAEQQDPNAASGALSTVKVVERVGLSELAALLTEATAGNKQVLETIHLLGQQVLSVETAVIEVQDLKNLCKELSGSLSLDKTLIAHELSGVILRFDAIQRKMLIDIDDAREDAKKWKAKYVAARDEAETWRITMTQRFNKQQEDIAFLRGKLDGMLLPGGSEEEPNCN